MTDRATANLPAKSLDETETFFAALGFATAFRDDGWMILQRGSLELEFFPHPELDPKQSWFSACLRVDDLDTLYAAFQRVGLPNDCWSTPRLTPPVVEDHGMRIFALVDPNGSLIRCIDNVFTGKT